MRLNKKAQNITNPYVVILILVVMSLFITLFFSFGGDIRSDPNNVLTDESVLYIDNYYGFDMDNVTTTDMNSTFYSSNTDTEGNLKDDALEFQFYREQSSGIRGRLNQLFNVPSALIGLLYLDRNDWATVIAAWNILAWLIILYGIYRFLRAIL